MQESLHSYISECLFKNNLGATYDKITGGLCIYGSLTKNGSTNITKSQFISNTGGLDTSGYLIMIGGAHI